MSEASGSLLIRGGTALLMDDAFTVARVDIRVVDGVITEIAPDLVPADGECCVNAQDRIILPGFVHTHIHLCQTLFRNLADDRALLDWLAERVWPLEASHDAESLRSSAELGLAELLLGGATGLVDMGTVHHTESILDAIERSGIRAVAGKCMMDAPDGPDGLRESTEDSLRESLDLADRWDGAAHGRIRYGFAPRFVLSCTDGLMRDVAVEAEARGLWVHTHTSENKDEIDIVRERSGGPGNVAFLASLGIAGPRTVLAHGVHLDADEPACLADAGTHLSHCPSSNLKLASGIADIEALLSAGVRVSLGADGAPCNNRLDMFTEMRLAALLQKVGHGPTALNAERALRMATRDGAAVFGREDLGQIAVGFRADLQVLELDPILDGPGGPLASRIVYSASRERVRTVMVDGRILVDEGRLTHLDRHRIATEAPVALKHCCERAGI